MNKFVLALAVAALTGGCTQHERVGDSGDYRISCPTMQTDICTAKARELCPKGYDVVGESRRGEFPMLLQNYVVVRCET